MSAFTLKNKNNNNTLITKEENTESRKEVISKRSTFAKHFLNEDGSYTMEVSPFPIHYYDSTKKSYEEIDNTLVESNDKFTITRDKMRLSFSKENNKNTPLFDLENKGHCIQLFYLGKTEKHGNRVLRQTFGKTRRITKHISNLTYEEVAPNIDLEYSVQYNQVKENIIIKEKQDNYEFSFSIKTGDLSVRLSDDETKIELIDKNNKAHYIIPSPVMFDSNNCDSTDLGYEIDTTEEGLLVFTLKANADWINAPERVFPVTIDPQVEITIDDDSFVRHYQISKDTATLTKSTGYIDNQSQSRAYLITFDLSDLLSVNVTSAELYFKTISSMPKEASVQIYYYGISSTENNKSTFTINTSKETKYANFDGPTSGSISVDVLAAFSSWIRLKHTLGALLFRSTDVIYSPYTFNPPKLTIQYTFKDVLPNFYISLKNDCITEVITDTDVGFQNKIISSGILVTYVDRVNNIVYQTLRVKDRIFTRSSINSKQWDEWKKQSLRAEVVDDVLYLTDED